MTYVDTNYFLRFLLRDVSHQHREARSLFEEGAAGKIKLMTSLVVIFEVYWVLGSFYKHKPKELAGVLGKVLSLSFIGLPERDHMVRAVQIFAKQPEIGLEDCYHIAAAQGNGAVGIATFDKKLLRVFTKASA